MIAAGLDLQTIIWAVMALLIVGGAVYSARRQAKERNAGGPGVLLSAVIWLGIIAILVIVVQAADFWARLGSLFR